VGAAHPPHQAQPDRTRMTYLEGLTGRRAISCETVDKVPGHSAEKTLRRGLDDSGNFTMGSSMTLYSPVDSVQKEHVETGVPFPSLF